MDTDEIWYHVHAERAALAELLTGLTAAEWRTPSLCADWTVHEVAAHVISSPQARTGPFVVAFVRARGDFNRLIRDEAIRAAVRYPPAEVLAQYKQYDGSRRHPPGTAPVDPLLDVLIHTQDIVRSLGRQYPMPLDAAREAADRIWARSFPFHARKRFTGRRLVAIDTDWAVGEGTELRAPMQDLALLLSGRPVSVSAEEG